MKKNLLLLSLVGFGLTVASAHAATTPDSNPAEIVRLPVHRVEAPRLTAAERKVEQSLAELRAAATPAPRPVKVEMPAVVAQQKPQATQPAPKVVVVAAR